MVDPAVVKAGLINESSATCQVRIGRKRKRADDEPVNPVTAMHLNKSRWKIRAGSDELKKCSYRTLCRWIRVDHWEFSTGSRRLDVCDKCNQWDRQIHRLVQTSVRKWTMQLEELLPTYMARWKTDVVPTLKPKEDVEDISVAYVESFENYIAGHEAWRTANAGGGLAYDKIIDMTRLEAAILAELRRDWLALKPPEPSAEQEADAAEAAKRSKKEKKKAKKKEKARFKAGLVDTVRWCYTHFGARDHQNAASMEDQDNPKPHRINFRMDFKQSMNLPVGPNESGCWWYAGIRLQVTVLTIVVWSLEDGGRKTYYTYMSKCMDHSCLFVQACFRHLFSEGLTAKQEKVYADSNNLNMWCDCGPHYRGGLFMGYWLVSLPDSTDKTSGLNYDVEGHGKGIVDAHFGKMTHWLHEAARVREITNVMELKEAMEEQSALAAARNPTGNSCIFFEFDPPPKSELLMLGLDCDELRKKGMGVQSSYAWSSEKELVGQVVVHMHGLSGKASLKQCYGKANCTLAGEDKEAAKGDWRYAYRQEFPEKQPPSLSCLKKHHEEMRAMHLPVVGRHATHEQKCEKLQRVRAQKKLVNAAVAAADVDLRAKALAPAVPAPPSDAASDDSSGTASSSDSSSGSSTSSSDSASG